MFVSKRNRDIAMGHRRTANLENQKFSIHSMFPRVRWARDRIRKFWGTHGSNGFRVMRTRARALALPTFAKIKGHLLTTLRTTLYFGCLFEFIERLKIQPAD